MIKLTNDLIREMIAQAGLGVPAPNKLHILGLRGASMISSDEVTRNVNEEHLNEYNDSIILFGTSLQTFRASTDPGKYWTQRPASLKGCAHLKEGKWFYRRGMHKGHPALVQDAVVTVIRDYDKDGKIDPTEQAFSGYFGINIHAGGTSGEVNKWSAGCQVIWGGWDGTPWKTFIGRIGDRSNMQGQDRFEYYLLNAAKLHL